MIDRKLDLITMGRAIVDVYGDQVGCRLEEVRSFSRYVGGCPANIAIGTARLGLRVGMITRVGDEQHGRFLREELTREGVDVTCVRTDPDRLTGVAFLGIRDRETFPLLHYRRDCADMAISPDDYSEAYIAKAKALLFSGSHLTTIRAADNIAVAVQRARAHGTRLVFDIDFRPLFWGLAHQDQGESRFAESAEVTAASQRFLPYCDLVVGTEEEIHITGGSTDTLVALRAMRRLTDAAIVLKRGPRGCVVFPGAVPPTVDDGIVGPGFPVEVFNVVGAGDGFMSGFLYGWLRDASWDDCCRYGNACGALVVSRHGCSPASPTHAELTWFLEQKTVRPDLFRNGELAYLHRATTRRPRPHSLQIVACDVHPGLPTDRFAPGRTRAALASLIASVALRLRSEVPGVGVLFDSRHGETALYQLGAELAWTARQLDAGSRAPLELEGGQPASITLGYWPQHLIAKVGIPEVAGDGSTVQAERLREVFLATQHHGNELLLEIASDDSESGVATLRERIRDLDEIGVRPDWWMLPAFSDPRAWDAVVEAVLRRNPLCRGIIVVEARDVRQDRDPLLRDPPRHPLVKGFALRGAIITAPARAWLAGDIDDAYLERSLREHLIALTAH